jgi:hypothetical protein
MIFENPIAHRNNDAAFGSTFRAQSRAPAHLRGAMLRCGSPLALEGLNTHTGRLMFCARFQNERDFGRTLAVRSNEGACHTVANKSSWVFTSPVRNTIPAALAL